MTQISRTATFFAFRDSNSAVLFCTDVAARGLDLPNVNWILQYDPPSDPRAYIHRIGRTARLGHLGNAVVFVTSQEQNYVDILRSKQMDLTEIALQTVLNTLKTNFEKNTSKNPEIEAGALQFRIQYLVNQDKEKELELKALAIKAFQSFVRSYATHTRSTRHIFDMKNLHLGHVSKIFGLIDTPTSFGTTLTNNNKKKLKVKKKAIPLSLS